MQDATPALSAAMGEGTVTWVRPAVWADWANDGYGASASIDDLSQQASGPIVIDHHLGDGLPDDISFVAGDEAATATIPMGGGRGALQAPSQYFSPYRTDSPIYGYDRDVPPVKVETGAVTSGGRQYVRVFTGQMADTPITTGRKATVQAISGTRLKLAKSIHLPPLDGRTEGLTGTWPVSWAMSECEVFVSPPPRSGCRYWAPLHGSLRAHQPAYHPASHGWQGLNFVNYVVPGGFYIQEFPGGLDGEPDWTDGPYLEAPNFRATADMLFFGGGDHVPLVDGDPLWDQSGAKGRIEYLVRGDPIDVNIVPGGSAAFGTGNYFAAVGFEQGFAHEPVDDFGYSFRVFVRLSDRKPVLEITDRGGTQTLAGSTPLPTDGAWYGIGAAWDYAASKVWLYYNGTVTSSTGFTLNTADLPAAGDTDLFWLSTCLPMAEIHVTAGVEANPDNYPLWVFDAGYFEPSAVIGRSRLSLVALADTQPRDAWGLIGDYAQAELASLRTDELDRALYLPLSWWVLHDMVNTAVDTLSTEVTDGQPGSIGDLQVTTDIGKIRNSATVRYQQASITAFANTNSCDPIFELRTVIPIPPGVLTLDVTFDLPAIYISSFAEVLHAASNDTLASIAAIYPNINIVLTWITANTSAAGDGTYATESQVQLVVGDDWQPGGARITITNHTGTTYYLANNVNIPALAVFGMGLHLADTTVTVRDPNSIAVRGERNVAVGAPVVQTAENAAWLATAIVGEHAYPIPRVENLEVWADPRRQPGDLVRIVDAGNTGLDDSFRLMGVKHTVDGGGAKYVQTVTGRRQKPTGVWDVSNWDECVWGE